MAWGVYEATIAKKVSGGRRNAWRFGLHARSTCRRRGSSFEARRGALLWAHAAFSLAFSLVRARLRWKATRWARSMVVSRKVLTQSRSQGMATPPWSLDDRGSVTSRSQPEHAQQGDFFHFFSSSAVQHPMLTALSFSFFLQPPSNARSPRALLEAPDHQRCSGASSSNQCSKPLSIAP